MVASLGAPPTMSEIAVDPALELVAYEAVGVELVVELVVADDAVALVPVSTVNPSCNMRGVNPC